MEVITVGTSFIIAGIQRTGTTFLRTTLDAHPSIFCCGESFQHRFRPLKGKFKLFGKYTQAHSYYSYRAENLSRWVSGVFNRKNCINEYLDAFFGKKKYESIGFKLMYSHVIKYPEIWNYIIQHKVKIIYFDRENIVKIHLSRLRNRRLKTAHVKEKMQYSKIYVPVSHLIVELDSITAEYRKWDVMLGDVHDLIHVKYEEFVRDRENQLDRIFRFIKATPNLKVKSKLKKINDDRMENVIENYDEVVDCLSKTSYAGYLD